MKKELWEEVLLKVREDIPKESYEIWFKPIKPVNIQGNILEIGVPNVFFKTWMNDRFKLLVDNHLKNITNNLMSIDFVVSSEVTPSQSEEKINVVKEKKYTISDFYLNSKYTFDSFVIGESNHFAHAACQAVADKPGTSYNPLFIYSGVGLGKTHLIHAIGHQILQNKPNAKIVYVSSEQFLNEFVDAIRSNKSQKFKDKYRNIDVLLIDDIQFLSGKEGIQEEFFHTFNTLHGLGKQVVLTSDKPPKEIKTLEERLRSRFEGGLIADIQFPCIETRMAIIKKKSEKEGVLIPDDVGYFIASKIKTNIRELEGALVRIIAYTSLTQEKLDINMVKKVLKNILLFNEQPESISIETIQRKTSKYFKIQLSDILGKRRNSTVVTPRQVAMYLCRNLTTHSLPEIAKEFGGRDHGTVMHACNKIKEQLEKDTSLQYIIQHIESDLKQAV
ncbi:MAG: chromosomal replication initiator protein DnaA [bacterium]|nr:chromosomal replication initiator protein DnaA [bacterium]